MRGGRAIAAVFALATLLVTSTSAAHDMRVLGRTDEDKGPSGAASSCRAVTHPKTAIVHLRDTGDWRGIRVGE